MSERYEPASDFLKAVAADEVPLSGSEFAEANFHRLVEMTRDENRSNRDWATLLLSQQEIDTPEVRKALLAAACDEDEVVRAEAVLGLAQRDKSAALPFVIVALSGEQACMAVFEAAALIADPSLADFLRPWTESAEDDFLDRLAHDALIACENGSPLSKTA
jgi:HEAT repeat protein